MRHHNIIILLTIGVCISVLNSCSANKEPKEIKVVNFEELAPVFTVNDNVLYVVNFWATWCAPCVKELPAFMEVNSKFKDRKEFKMILVSLDDVDRADDTVKKFAQDKNLDPDIYLLDDVTRMNEWVPAVDLLWSGAIPATLFIRNGVTLRFVEAEMTQKELETIIEKLI